MPDEINKIRNAAAGPEAGEMILWKARCIAFKQNGHWPTNIGPKPGEPGCEAPQEALSAAGLEVAA